jgi:hypothetical protein
MFVHYLRASLINVCLLSRFLCYQHTKGYCFFALNKKLDNELPKRNSALKALQLINKVRMHTRLISWTANLGSEQMAPQKILIRTEHLTVFSFEIRFGKQIDNDLQT